jgi:DNA-binding LacI/PurR family transcriptional regulator
MNARPSLKTVAAVAGVSVSSVSNAYNNPERLSTEVRERILRIADEQGYGGPDTAARTLRGKRAGAIGLLFTEKLSYAFSDPYSVGMLAGLAEVAEETSTSLTLIPLAPVRDKGSPGFETSLEAVKHAVVDGIVAWCVDLDHPAREVIKRRGLPMVSSSEDGDPASGHVVIDEKKAARSVGRLLQRLGHRQAAVLVPGVRSRAEPGLVAPGDVDAELYDEERLRLAGFTSALGAEATVTVIAGGYNSEAAGYTAAALAMDLDPAPTALLCISDVLAFGAMRALRDQGLVPGVDVSVTGFDDVPMAEILDLTTVRQEIRERGRLFGRMLLDPSYAERQVVLPTKLRKRGTTGPAPS